MLHILCIFLLKRDEWVYEFSFYFSSTTFRKFFFLLFGFQENEIQCR